MAHRSFTRPVGPLDIKPGRRQSAGFFYYLRRDRGFILSGHPREGLHRLIVRSDGHDGTDARIASGPMQREACPVADSQHAHFFGTRPLLSQVIQ